MRSDEYVRELRARRDWFEGQPERSPAGAPAGSRSRRYTCPCCGYPTLEERGAYDICELCWWEDDGQDDSDSSKTRGGPNGEFSLDEARANFRLYRLMYPPDRDPRFGGPDSEIAVAAKRRMIEAFDAMPQAGSDLGALWGEVAACSEQLQRELSRSLEGASS
jgi:hypothetical protein